MSRLGSLSLVLLLLASACGDDEPDVSDYTGSFSGAFSIDLIPEGGVERSVVITDVLVTGLDVTTDDSPSADFQLDSSGDWDCLLTGDLVDNEPTIVVEGCDLTEGTERFGLSPGGAVRVEASGAALTIEMAGEYTSFGLDPESGTFSGELIAQRDSGTALTLLSERRIPDSDVRQGSR